MGRAPCCDKANVKRGPWSPEEDAKLKSYIEKHGTGGNWIALPTKIGLKRCGKSCRLRWLNYLRPNIKHGGFTQEEDNLICTLYISIGSRWSIIAGQLPGRTDNDIKNYWNTRLKKKLMGRQLRRQQRQYYQSLQLQAQNYSINDSIVSLYMNNQISPPTLYVPNTSVSLLEPAACNNLQQTTSIVGLNPNDFLYTCDPLPSVQDQHLCAINSAMEYSSTSMSLQQLLGDIDFDERTSYDPMPQDQMDGFDNLFDISSCLVNNPAAPALSNYEVLQSKTPPQISTLFDHPKILGYSE